MLEKTPHPNKLVRSSHALLCKKKKKVHSGIMLKLASKIFAQILNSVDYYQNDLKKVRRASQ